MDLFDDDQPAPWPPPASPIAKRPTGQSRVEPADTATQWQELAERLPATLHMGTSSWSFPGWQGLVWGARHSGTDLAHQGLPAYSRHPLLRSVSLDRSFYRPLSASEYAAYAAQVPEHFRFVVKAPSLVCDALVRGSDGRGQQDNPPFLDPALANSEFVQPAIDGWAARSGRWCSSSARCRQAGWPGSMTSWTGWPPCWLPCIVSNRSRPGR